MGLEMEYYLCLEVLGDQGNNNNYSRQIFFSFHITLPLHGNITLKELLYVYCFLLWFPFISLSLLFFVCFFILPCYKFIFIQQ